MCGIKVLLGRLTLDREGVQEETEYTGMQIDLTLTSTTSN